MNEKIDLNLFHLGNLAQSWRSAIGDLEICFNQPNAYGTNFYRLARCRKLTSEPLATVLAEQRPEFMLMVVEKDNTVPGFEPGMYAQTTIPPDVCNAYPEEIMRYVGTNIFSLVGSDSGVHASVPVTAGLRRHLLQHGIRIGKESDRFDITTFIFVYFYGLARSADGLLTVYGFGPLFPDVLHAWTDGTLEGLAVDGRGERLLSGKIYRVSPWHFGCTGTYEF